MTTEILATQHTPAFVAARKMVWLLTVDYAGTVRVSSDDVDVACAATGQTLRYHAGLGRLRHKQRLGIVGDINEGNSSAVDCLFPVDVALLESRGHRLAGVRAELARWVVGTDFSDRHVVAVGEVVDPVYGADREPVSFSLEAVVWTTGRSIPSSSQSISERNWGEDDIATLDEGEREMPYPIIIGKPGLVASSVLSRGWITGSRARRCDRTTVTVLASLGGGTAGWKEVRAVLAGHHVKATRVYASTNADPAGERFAVVNGFDNRGQPVAYLDATPDGATIVGIASPSDFEVDPDGDGNPTYGLGSTDIDDSYRPRSASLDAGRFDLFVGWYNDANDPDGGEGGLTGVDGKLIRGAGDVLLWMMSRTDKPIDLGRFAAAAPLLNGYLIDAVIDDYCQPWAWVRDHLLKILPVSIATGPNGIYPIVWRYEATTADAVFILDTAVDPRIQRVGRVTVDSSKIANEFSLEFAHSIRTGNFFGRVSLGAGPYDSEDPDSQVSIHCRLSQQRHRQYDGRARVVERSLQSRVIYDRATALSVLSWQASAWTFPRRGLTYLVPEADFSHLRRGMFGIVRDHELHTEWGVHVLDVQILDNGTIGLDLLYIENPVRDALDYSS